MKIRKNEPPRRFKAGKETGFEINDVGDIYLEPNEQVTFVTNAGRRYDVVYKEWGFYATPSANGRLKDEGFKTALVMNQQDRVYVMLVEVDKQGLFESYCKTGKLTVLEWLSDATGERFGRLRGRVD